MIEIIAVIFTLWCVYLTINQNIFNWPIGILGILAYLYIFYAGGLYFQSGLQVVFLAQSIYGWYYWKKNTEVKWCNEVCVKNFMVHLLLILLVIIFIGIPLERFTTLNQPVLDTLTTLLSLLANMYLARKNILGWLLWAMCDVFMVCIFLNEKLYWSVGLYTLLCYLAIRGFSQWGKSVKISLT